MIPKRRQKPRMGLREPSQIRSPAHLKWVRGHECAIAGRMGKMLGRGGVVEDYVERHICGGRIEAAHVRIETDGGMQVKPSDRYTIPLCEKAHAEQHSIGETTFEKRWGIRMKEVADALWRASPHRKRHENP